MEEQKVILKIFRALLEEGEGCVTQENTRRSFSGKKNDDQVCEKRSSLSHVLLPPGGEEISCDSEEAENGTNMTETERNLLNRWAENTEVGFGTERELSVQTVPQQVACQHLSVCTAALKQDDDGGEAKQRVGKESEHSDVTFDAKEASKTSSSPTALAQIGPEAGEQDGSAEHFSLENTKEEGSGAEEESKNKETKVCPDRPSSPKDTSLNTYITPSDWARKPPPGTTVSRATFAPGSPPEKHLQLPALFSGLRVLRRGVSGPEHDTVAQIRPPDTEILSEKEEGEKGSILEQISNFLSREKSIEKEEKQSEEDGGSGERQSEEVAEAACGPVKRVSSAEAAFDAFKAFFTPKPLKKDPGDKVDLEAVRKRIKAERDALRALFERSSVKSSEQKESSDQVGATSYGTQHTLY